jgi:hypothetical protein
VQEGRVSLSNHLQMIHTQHSNEELAASLDCLVTFEKIHGPVCRERESRSDPHLFFLSFRQ